ncbi:MAG: hypothetical protein II972_00865 [Elusimicrobiaceae bacterium]|nr:hypothetical protein [Elusimicrobiaceae bacterium]
MIKFLNVFFIFIIATIAHWLAIETFGQYGIILGVMFSFTLVMATKLSEFGGYLFGFLSGLFLDFFGNNLFGANALAFTWVLFVFYIIDDKIDFRDSAPQMVITAVLNMVLLIFYGLISKFFIGEFIWQGFVNFVVGSVLTGLFLPVIYFVINKYLSWGPLRNINEAKRFF